MFVIFLSRMIELVAEFFFPHCVRFSKCFIKKFLSLVDGGWRLKSMSSRLPSFLSAASGPSSLAFFSSLSDPLPPLISSSASIPSLLCSSVSRLPFPLSSLFLLTDLMHFFRVLPSPVSLTQVCYSCFQRLPCNAVPKFS